MDEFLSRRWRAPPAVRYGLALAVALIALALHHAAHVQNVRFVNFTPAVMLAALLGGVGPGLLATIVCALAANYLWLAPGYSLSMDDTSDRVAISTFVASGALMSWLVEILYRMRDRAEQARAGLQSALANAQKARDEAERAAAETKVLFRLADGTAKCETPSDICNSALDGVRDLLGAERAAIRLLGHDGAMHYRAWRGLSERYRAAMTDYLPWRHSDRAPKAVMIVDVECDEKIVRYHAAIKSEGIRSLAFIPLVQGRCLVGNLTLAWASPQRLSAHELDVALTIASHIAQVLARAAAHDDLRRAEEKLSAALDAGGMGAWTWDPDLGRVTWSATLAQIHGIAPGAFAGTFEAYQRDIHPEDKQRVLATLREAWGEKRAQTVEYRIVRPDGALRWLAARGKVVADSEGRPVGMAGVCMDITERKELERLREGSALELERSVRFYELFTGILGHDLRNPLGAASIAAELALALNADEKLVAPLSKILRCTDRMAMMVDQLLDFTRGRLGGGIPVEPRPIDLLAVLRQVIDELDRDDGHGSVRLEHAGEAHGAWDPDCLAQVFSNLIANALQHGATSSPVAVRLDGSAPETVKVDVHNMGSIPVGLVPTIFEPLVSGGASRRGSRGLGLGLFISREILRAHGGKVEVQSEERAGTTFTVVLPRWPDARTEDPSSRTRAELSRTPASTADEQATSSIDHNHAGWRR